MLLKLIPTNTPMFAFWAGESSSSLCYCKERGDEAIPVRGARVEIAEHLSGGRNDNITIPSAPISEGMGKAQFHVFLSR